MDVRASSINSDNKADWAGVEVDLADGKTDILLISPERLTNEHFVTDVLAAMASNISLLVVDEAHCISDWGHDFRPHYRLVERILGNLPRNVRVLATTATANSRVLEDLNVVLGPNLTVIKGELGRPSLLLQTLRLPGQAERMAWLATHLPKIAGSGIVYTLTVRDAKQLAEWLQSRGINAKAYTAETDNRRELENELLANSLKALVATVALGMGFDKPDLAFVIHYQTPGSVIAYYQQVGRAGRALAAAHGVLLSGEEETNITDYFIKNAFPTRQEVEAVLSALRQSRQGLTVYELMNVVNVSKGRIEKTLQLLSLESPPPIVFDENKWRLVAARLADAFWQRAQRLTDLRRSEQQQMQDYVQLTSGHMNFLIRALDGEPSVEPTPPILPLPSSYDPSLAKAAAAFLRHTHLTLEPRKMWPYGGLPKMRVKGRIPELNQARAGRALCRWGDACWGTLVKEGKYSTGRFSNLLVEACADMVRAWSPQPAPTWVTCIPSRRSPNLVPDFARRLASVLHLPFFMALEKTHERRPQKEMANSPQQAGNVDGSLEVVIPIPSGPVLLVDDMVDSGWTFTVAAYLLTSHGGGSVYPLALASTAKSDS